MTTIYEILNKQLLERIAFEEKLTNFVGAWRSDYRFSSGIVKTFPEASFELFLKLAGKGDVVTPESLLQGGCKSYRLAVELHAILLTEEATVYNTFVKRLAVLPYKDLHHLFDAFYCELFDASLRRIMTSESSDNIPDTTQHTSATGQKETSTTTNRRYWWWQRYKCVCPFNRKRNTWY
jgi:hypothetical protein